VSEFESRYAQINADAIDDTELTLTDLRVLGVIGYHSGRKKPAWPKQATIASRLKVTRETVNRSIRRLHRKGYIDIAHQFRDDGGQRESYYFPRFDPEIEVQPVEVTVRGKTLALVPRVIPASQGESDAAVTPPVTQLDHTPCDEATSHLEEQPTRTPHMNITPNPRGNRSKAASSKSKPTIAAPVKAEFDQLWKLWPAPGRERSKSRDHVLEQFAKAAGFAPASHIVEAAAVFVRKTDAKFVPGLDRWLRDRKFEHFLPQAAELPLDDGGKPAPGVDWPAMVQRYVRSGIWPDRLGDRPDEIGYRGALAPLEAIMATGKFGDLNVPVIRLNIDRLRAKRDA
jgi:hypothetical protein